MAKEILNLEVNSNIKSVTKESDDLGTSLGKSVDETKDLGSGLEDAGTKGKKGFALVTGGVKAFGLALKAAGIGLVIAILASLKEALERNQTVMNAVNTIMTTLSTTFNQVVEVLTDVYKWVTDSSDRFDGLTKVIGGLMTLALTPLKLAFYSIKLAVEGLLLAWEDSFLGGGDEERIIALSASIRGTADDIKAVGEAAIDAGKDIINNIGDAIGEIGDIGEMAIKGVSEISIKSNYEMAQATTAAANSSKLAEAQIQGLIEKYDRQAELQRQIRDDERKTFAERKTANDEIAKILKKQETEMMALANTRVAAAKLELAANKTNIDLQVAYQATLNDRAGVEAQIAGFRSEQIVNEASLEKELAETKKQIAAELLEGQDRELLELKQAYELKLDMARKAGVGSVEITKKYEKERQAILDEAAAAGKAITDKKLEDEEALGKSKLAMELAMANQGLQILGDAAGEGTAIAKAAAIAQATISGVQGVQNAFTSANANIGATAGSFGAYPVTMATLAGVFAAANIAKIASGSSAIVPDLPSPSTTPPAPQMMSGAFELTGGQEPEPLQAYVVSDDITNNQNKLAIIRRRATI
tara:strand:- start:163 stop:1929 length:1767 start_codon:yes stop_codon:yes gene_type:complete